MASRISELVIEARDPGRLAAFWREVLGYVELERIDGSIEIGPPETGFGGLQPTIVLSPNPAPKTSQLRLHIDVSPTDRDQDAELDGADPPGSLRRRGRPGHAGQLCAPGEGNGYPPQPGGSGNRPGAGSERSLALGKLGEDPVRRSKGREFLAAVKHAEDP